MLLFLAKVSSYIEEEITCSLRNYCDVQEHLAYSRLSKNGHNSSNTKKKNAGSIIFVSAFVIIKNKV